MNIDSARPIMIFKEEIKKHDGTTFIKYNASLSRKMPNSDTYENASFPIEFMQGVELHHKTKIEIAPGDAWLSFYKYQVDVNGEKKNRHNFFVKCKKFTIVEGGQVNVTPKEITKEEVKVNVDKIFEDFGETVTVEEDNSYLD